MFDMMPILDVTPQSFDRLFAVNVRGFFFVMQAVARRMAADGRGGSIVNMASQAGRRGLYAKQFNLPPGEKKKQVGLAVPLGRMGRAEEIAKAVMFLASDQAEYVVGQTLNVDGGSVLS